METLQHLMLSLMLTILLLNYNILIFEEFFSLVNIPLCYLLNSYLLSLVETLSYLYHLCDLEPIESPRDSLVELLEL